MNENKIVVITPVRNAEEYLDKFFSNISIFADAVVFLEDGSTDNTYNIIKEHPLTSKVLRNPVRFTTYGWNANMNFIRLTEYVRENFSEDWWVIYMGIDSCLHPAERIRDLCKLEYDGNVGIGFLLVTPSGEESYLPNGPFPVTHTEQTRIMIKMWKNKKEYNIPVAGALHSDRHPPQIDTVFSSLCFYLHYGSSTYERRMTRYKKYTEEVDPDNIYQPTYEHLHPDNFISGTVSLKL